MFDKRPVRLLVLLLVCVSFGACAATRGRKVENFSGFLKDYDQLKPGKKDGVLVWIKPNLSLKNYKRVMFDKPVFLLTKEARESIGEETLANLTSYFVLAANEQVGEYWEMVDEAGPDVVQLRIAISELSGATAALTPFSRVLPQGILISTGVSLVTGEYPFIGKVTAEAELLDSVTGERLVAGVDRRVGNNAITNVASTWGDVKDAFTFWAKRFRRRLLEKGMVPTKVEPAVWQKEIER